MYQSTTIASFPNRPDILSESVRRDYLLYGRDRWGYPKQLVVPSNRGSLGGGEVNQILLPHGVDRIEQLGNDAVVIGTDGTNLQFSAVR